MFSSMMAKKRYKQHSKSETIQVGCMSGLIRMLDFRRNPKLLSDGRVKTDPKASEDIHVNISANNEKSRRVELIYSGRASIKTLMEEEMNSSTQLLKQAQRNATGICSEDIDLNLAVSLMEIYRNHSEGQDISNSIEAGHTSISTNKENNSDPPAHLNQIPSSIQRALEDVAEAVIRHQSANTKYTTDSGEVRSKEFVDALQSLSSNKELFLMLMQDPSSRLLECLQNLYMSLGSTKLGCEEYDEESELQGMTNSLEQSVTSPSKVERRHNSFLKEDKLVMRKPPKLNDNSRGLSRIVILKPTPARSQSSLISSSATSSSLSNHTNLQIQEVSDKSDRHFSLRELKRRLRLAVSDNQKDHQLNSMSSTFHKAEADSSKQLPVSSMSVSLASTDSSDSKGAEEPSIVDKKTVPEDSGSGTRNDVTHGVGSFSYQKAKMYLIDRLNNQGEDSSQIVHKSESLERLISLPESGTFSPSRCPQEENVSLSHEATNPLDLHTIEQEDSSASPNPTELYLETESANTINLANNTLVELKVYHGNHQLTEGAISQELSTEGVKIMPDTVGNLPLCAEIETSRESVGEKVSDQCPSEEPQSMNVLPEVALHSPDDPVNEQENHCPSEVVELVKPSVLTFPYSPENTNDREEKLSPQSVLDSVVGDITSPRHKTQKRDELFMPTSRALFKEHGTRSASPTLWNGPKVAILDYKDARVSFIKAVLEASKLSSEDNSWRWCTEESLLDISVLAEVGNLYCLTDDAVLLFDCVEEVILEIRDKFFGVDPWVAFLKHNVRPAPVGRNLVQEVAKCIDALVSNEFPNTLDKVIMKDLESGSWMDLRRYAESVVIELWDGLLDDLLEEMVFDLWLQDCNAV
ncbi:uncharacterized protein LOC133924741 [Phragmites australis]|uniref:uncharacterized protein LOC133924741 n=1 Tax=Phragmites australis TaxID=29695 RepID=UPI002D7825A8|nr:uncharacterized protein LOC133924741 [Phragmites australis]XP_062226408.1 uncharacterized protein LOC133924741 [Phragmites australis]XP_062226409.1 uncharacterized protein LOC133924741 [Phragmites australis]XP_062226410.1 uncharacterized protein LOC133924741 [Phragmites australis]XP_062226411.1 uncharacterized protein LOC133924741 [Phragmites australis]